MSVIMTGYQFKAFYTDDWGGAFWDDFEIELNGELLTVDYEQVAIQHTDKVKILSGVVYTDGTYEGAQLAADTFARRWLKAQTTDVLTIQVDKTHLPDVLVALGNMTGVRIL